MNNRFLLVIGACIVVFFGLLVMNKKDAGAPSADVKPSNHVQGKGERSVTLIEYGDFQCPACGAFHPILKEVKAKYGDQITFQFRHYPLVQIHPNAMAAHRAAEAAGQQGKFFEMHDILYERQTAWSSANGPAAIFEGYAQELGLDMSKFKADVASSAINDIIQKDIQEGQAISATSTPTFVLDGKKLEENPRDIEGFNKLIDEAIKAKQNQ